MPQYKLIYFPLRGRAEFIRYILHHAGIPFKDERIPFDKWAEFKSEMVMGQLPVLEVDANRLAQSRTIGRYLAKEFGLAGKTAWEEALCDMYVDALEDLNPDYKPVYEALFAKDEKLIHQNWGIFKEKTLLPFLDRFEKILSENKTGYLVGKEVTWADLMLAELMERFVTIYEPAALDGHPIVKANMLNIHALPNINKYVKERPKYEFVD